MLFISRNWAVVCHSVDSDDTPRARELIGLSDYKHYKHLHQMRCGCMWTLRVDCSLRPAVKCGEYLCLVHAAADVVVRVRMKPHAMLR